MSYFDLRATKSPLQVAATIFESVAQVIGRSSSSSSSPSTLSGDSAAATTNSSPQLIEVKRVKQPTLAGAISPSALAMTPPKNYYLPTAKNVPCLNEDGTIMMEGDARETNGVHVSLHNGTELSRPASRHEPNPYPYRPNKSVDECWAARPAPAAAHPGHAMSLHQLDPSPLAAPRKVPPYAIAVPQPTSKLAAASNGGPATASNSGPSKATHSMTTNSSMNPTLAEGTTLATLAAAAPATPPRFSGVPLYSTTPPRSTFRSTSGKKRPSAVQRVDRLELPCAFWANKEADSEQDNSNADNALTRLVGLFQTAGSEEQSNLFISWTNPEYQPTFQDFCYQAPPTKAPPPRLPKYFEPPYRTQVPEVHANSKKGRGQPGPQLADVDTIAEHVQFDNRYVEFNPKLGVLNAVPEDKTRDVRRLDQAQFRDYRLMPCDLFVQDCPLPQPPDDDSPLRRGRRVRGGDSSADSSVSKVTRVGNRFQAVVPPRPEVGGYRKDIRFVPECDQLWDPKLAKEAELRGEDIEGFLSQGTDLNSSCLLMEALHRGGYNCEKATDEFVSLYRRAKEPSTQLRLDEIFVCKELFALSKKNFREISRRTKRSVGAVLVQYYHWKGANEGDCYTKLKREMKADSDFCAVCDDGGSLIVCDRCHRGFHLDCLPNPLKKVPEDDWYCFHCVKSPCQWRKLPPPPPLEAEHVNPPPAKKRLIFPDKEDNDIDGDKKPRAREIAAPAAGFPIGSAPVGGGESPHGFPRVIVARMDRPNVVDQVEYVVRVPPVSENEGLVTQVPTDAEIIDLCSP